MNQYTNETVEVFYDSEANCVITKWLGYANSQLYRQVAELRGEMLVNVKTNKILIDNTLLKVVLPADQKWMMEENVPKFVNALGRKIILALVTSKDIFANAAAQNILQHSNEFLDYKMFENYDKAYQWLKEQ